ncbi:putative Ccr4-associated factor [Melia azedarach]|uniref:Ccr4-associated factor n=1 Tax=Melia azedarach TaxID=155640 RepID=A0ACC1X3S5_MELAZ|nr:putative Ccr4-associated factor [Melia azedarach]
MSDVQPPPHPKREIEIREVFACNLVSEFEKIRSLVDRFPIISMDTEFPGVVVRADSNGRHREPNANYASLKANVDLLNLIQIGITLSDEKGNLPDLGSGSTYYIWEFNFKDFDISRHPHAPDSVELLRRQGIDFETNREDGIDSVHFAELLMSSGLVLSDAVTWVTFHSAYDFGYLVKCLTQSALPETLTEFLVRVGLYFGENIYDVKHLTRFCTGLYGGLDRVCKALNIERVVGKSHQAGSDSLLTLHAFLKIKDRHFLDDEELEKYANVLHGLEVLEC